MPNKKNSALSKSFDKTTDEEIMLNNTTRANRFKRERGRSESFSAPATTDKRRKKKLSKKKFYHQKLHGNNIVETLPSFSFSSSTIKPKVISSFLPVDIEFKKINSKSKLSNVLYDLELYKPKTDKEERTKRMYLNIVFILAGIHLVFASTMKSLRLSLLPPLPCILNRTIKIKFWAYLFETYFGHHSNVRLIWGETMSPICKTENLRFNIDLSFLVELGENTLQDVGVAEVSQGATQAKYFNDKAKMGIQ